MQLYIEYFKPNCLKLTIIAWVEIDAIGGFLL